MTATNTMHQFAQDKIVQDLVEGRSTVMIGFDFGVEAGQAGPRQETATRGSVDVELLQQAGLVPRMEGRSGAWRRMTLWLRGVARNGH